MSTLSLGQGNLSRLPLLYLKREGFHERFPYRTGYLPRWQVFLEINFQYVAPTPSKSCIVTRRPSTSDSTLVLRGYRVCLQRRIDSNPTCIF